MEPEAMRRAGLAGELWEATQRDGALLARLRAAYRGRLDLQDALWWRAHPLAITPGGRADPAAALGPLQEAVYSRVPASAQAVQSAEVDAERLRALTTQLARDAADLDAVLDRFGGGNANLSARPTGASDPTPDPTPAPHRAHPLVLVIVGAVLGVGATIGVQAVHGHGHGHGHGQPTVTQATSVSHTGGAVTKYFDAGTSSDAGQDSGSGGVGDVYEVFYHPAVFPGGVVPQLGRDVEPSSIRPIVFKPNDPGYRIYAAYTFAGTPCLFLQRGADATFSSCTSSARLEQDGLRLDAVLRTAEPGPDAATTLDVQVQWEENGSFSSTAKPVG
jgi:hypothetical protein